MAKDKEVKKEVKDVKGVKPAEKPTPEDLEKDIEKITKEAEDLKAKANDTSDIPDDPKDFIKEEEPEDEEPKEKVEEVKEEPKEEPKVKNDYKEKFINSTKEAQLLHAKNKKIMEAFEKSKAIPEPTEKELKKEYSDWDVMGDFEKKMAKENMMNTRRFASFGEVAEEFSDIARWNEKVEEFMGDPENLIDNPLLEGKEAEFKAFASKPSRRGQDFTDLINSFLWEESQEVKPKKGSMLPTGSGGDKTNTPKPTKLTVEQGRKLREGDYEKYKRYLMANMIEEI